MKMEQTELGFAETDPVFEAVVQKYSYDIESLDFDTPEQLLARIVRLTRPRGAEIGFADIKPHLTKEALALFNEKKDRAVQASLKRLDEIITAINPNEPVPEIFKLLIRDGQKIVVRLEALDARGYLTAEQKTLLEDRKVALQERKIEFAPLSDDEDDQDDETETK